MENKIYIMNIMNNISYSTDEDDTYLKYDEDIKKEEIDGAEINKLENEMYKENLDIIEDENNEIEQKQKNQEEDENQEEQENDDENDEYDEDEEHENNEYEEQHEEQQEQKNNEDEEQENNEYEEQHEEQQENNKRNEEKDDKKIEYFCDDIHLKILNYVNFTNYKMENIVFYSMIFGFLTVIPVLKNL